MFHHPLIALMLGWLALVAFTVQLDQGTLIVALTSAISPSLAVLLAYRLAKRTQAAVEEKLEKQNVESALRNQAAEEAVAKAEEAAEVSKVTADETHKLVNSQKDELERQLKVRDDRIEKLEAILATR